MVFQVCRAGSKTGTQQLTKQGKGASVHDACCPASLSQDSSDHTSWWSQNHTKGRKEVSQAERSRAEFHIHVTAWKFPLEETKFGLEPSRSKEALSPPIQGASILLSRMKPAHQRKFLFYGHHKTPRSLKHFLKMI